MRVPAEDSWPTTTNPRHLLKLSRVRPSGRQYVLLACAVVRHLVPGPRTEIGARVLDALERFVVAQPRKGVQTHVWNEVKRQCPELNSRRTNWQNPGADDNWISELGSRLEALSQVNAAVLNRLFDITFPQVQHRAQGEDVAEVDAICAALVPEPPAPRPRALGLFGRLFAAPLPSPEPTMHELIQRVRDEVVSRYPPEDRGAVSESWAEVADVPAARRLASALVSFRTVQRTEVANAQACELIREVFGNPFRPAVIDPAWLLWNYGAVRHIAERIAATGDFTDLPILGDALEDAGCGDEALLRHCREGKAHVPGCWALDAVLGK